MLQGLDAGLLERHHALFGGGTQLVLDLGEYRVSQDVDFLCSDAPAFAELRNLARRGGPEALFDRQRLTGIELRREIRADQYGIRLPVLVSGFSIKLEVISEGRIDLSPGARPPWSPVACLTRVDAYAEKLLSNCDRWPDRQVLARDLIDLSLLRVQVGPIPREAWSKAERAYGPSVRRDLRAALEAFLSDPAFQDRCFTGLAVAGPQEIVEGATRLLSDLGDSSPPGATV